MKSSSHYLVILFLFTAVQYMPVAAQDSSSHPTFPEQGYNSEDTYVEEWLDYWFDDCGEPRFPERMGDTGEGGKSTGSWTAVEPKGECEGPSTPSCAPNVAPNLWYKGGKKTSDECIWSETGNECSAGKCCDWTLKNGQRDKCDCNTSTKGACSTSQSCEICMCVAEGEGEGKKGKECVKAILCTIKNRAKKHNGDSCAAVLHQEPGSDAAQFTSKKCICDRTSPSQTQTDYNQNYCKCCEGSAKKPPVYPDSAKDCIAALKDLDCSQPPYNKITNFLTPEAREKYGKPCNKAPVKGLEKCGHEFYECSYNPA